MPFGKHPNDMSREELRQLVGDMTTMALDLAQHLNFTAMMKEEYRPDAYQNAERMAYELSQYPYDKNGDMKRGNCEVAVFGEGGLTVHRGDIGDILDAAEDATPSLDA